MLSLPLANTVVSHSPTPSTDSIADSSKSEVKYEYAKWDKWWLPIKTLALGNM